MCNQGVKCIDLHPMKNIIHKLKTWYRGKHIPYSMEEMIELQRPRYLEKQESLPNRFEPPTIAKILTTICRSWIRNWKILLPVIIAIVGIAVTLFIHFDSKSSSKTKKIHNSQHNNYNTNIHNIKSLCNQSLEPTGYFRSLS